MAHELCHLLYDQLEGGGTFMLSPGRSDDGKNTSRGGNWRPFESPAGVDLFEEMEQRANAFAAYFLAPASAVRAVVDASEHQPNSTEAAILVSETFGVGYSTAVNQLKNVFEFSQAERQNLLEAKPNYKSTFVFDERPLHVGLTNGQLTDLALEAFKQEKVGRVEVRRLLDLPMGAELPAGRVELTIEQRRPAVTREQQIMTRAMRWLREQGVHHDHHPTSAYRTSEGWTVTVGSVEGTDSDVELQALYFSHDMKPLGSL